MILVTQAKIDEYTAKGWWGTTTVDDRFRARVAEFLRAHDDVPMLLIGKDANEGLARARNTGFERARGDLVMVMDADNTIYPTCLRRLADALAAHPAAGAAYAILLVAFLWPLFATPVLPGDTVRIGERIF